MTISKMLEALDGTEFWTNNLGHRFDERVCVGFDAENKKLVVNGKRFTPTKKEMTEIWDEYIKYEFGHGF